MPRIPVDIDKAPVLLIEDVVWVRSTSRCNTTHIVLVGTSAAILPPFISKLKGEAAKADTTL